MKKIKYFECLIVLLLFVIVASFIISINKVFSASSVELYDWSERNEKLEQKYSYSTLFLTDQTRFMVYKDNGVIDENPKEKLFADVSVSESEKDNIFYVHPGKEFLMLITNCAVNKKGELLDVVVKVNNVKSFKNTSDLDVSSKSVDFRILNEYYVVANQNQEKELNYKLQENEPLVFLFEAKRSQADFTITYYKAGTYQFESDSGVLGEIDAVNGFYWDIDVVNNSYPDDLFGGNEGIKPIVGNTKIYYEKNNNDNVGIPNIHYKLSENYNGNEVNGVFINKADVSGGKIKGIYFETSAFMITDGLEDTSTFSFTYSGYNCGIRYMYASPYPFEIDTPTKSANKTEAKLGESFIYTISQYVPNNYFGTLFSYNEIYKNLYKTSRFNSIVIKDTIDSNLIIDQNNIKVINETNADVTSNFNILVDGNTVTATVKEEKFDIVNFYAHTYKMQIPVTVKSDIHNVEKITNKATTTSSICKDDSDCPSEEKETNSLDVKLKYKLKVNYYEKESDRQISPSEETYYYLNDLYETDYKDRVDLKEWQLSSTEGDPTSGEMTKDTEVTYYFEKNHIH